MKILLAVTDSGVGGITTAAVNMCNELVRRGHDVYFLDMSAGNMCADRLHPDVTLGSLSGRSVYWNLTKSVAKGQKGIKRLGMNLLGFIKKITIRLGLWNKIIFKRYTEFGRFDVAIAYRQCAPCYSFVLNCVDAPIKLAFVHGELGYMGDISSWLRYMPRFHKVCYVSEAVKDEFVRAYPRLGENAATVYNILDDEQIRRDMLSDDDLYDRNDFNIVTVSRVRFYSKRMEWIPEIYSRMRLASEGVKWHIIGSGEHEAALEELIRKHGLEDRIILHGAQENPYKYMSQADLLVLVSKSEAYGLVVVESLICGIPVVSTEYPALKEILLPEYGISVDSSVEAVAREIDGLIENTERYSALRRNCSQYKYSAEQAYSQFIEATKGRA